MKIRLLWVGKGRTGFISDGIEYYLKLLRPMVSLAVVEIKDAKCRSRASILEAEGKAILRATENYVLLDENGKGHTSIDFSILLRDRLQSDRTLDFVIGGAFGVSDEVRARAMEGLSLSKMTLTHEMTRLVFLEQLYRAFTIIKGKEYHY